MSEIKTFNLSHLKQDENFGFHNFALAELTKCNDSKIKELVNDYKVKYNVFDETMKVGGGENVLSYDVTRLDQIRDDTYRGLKRQNDVGLNDFDPVIAEIARQVDIILRRNGDPCNLPYLAENSAVTNLIQDLEEFDNQQVEGYFWLDPKVTKRSRLKLASYSVPFVRCRLRNSLRSDSAGSCRSLRSLRFTLASLGLS